MLPKHPNAAVFIRSQLFENLERFRDLEARIEAFLTVGERRIAFEVFVEAYLATQRTAQAQEIWPEGAIPPAVSKELNLCGGHGIYVDGVYRVLSGAYFAYKVEFQPGRAALSYIDVAPFFDAPGKLAQRVLITNSNDLPAQLDERGNFFCIRAHDFDRMEADDFSAIRTWLAGSPIDNRRKSPRAHQNEALQAILPVLETCDRATAVMACGSGKTLVALWVAERMGAKRILVLVPSLALIRQTLHEWLRETSWSEPSFMCVCSDPTVTKGVDHIQVHASDLDFPVTTDGKVASEFLAGPGTRIVFSTYQSAKVVAEGIRDSAAFDLGIFDEAHKTAGSEGKRNAFALKDVNLPIRKRLFLTATPRHASTTKRTAEGELALVYSMDDPATYGPIAYTLTFAEAAKRRIISDFKIVVSVVTSTSLNDELLSRGVVTVQDDPVKARQVANQIALEKAVREYGVSHIFSFHGNVKSAKSFTSEDPAGIASIIPGIVARHVNGEMCTADREAVIDEFRQAPLGIVSNARCLTEGVDLPAVDMVAFMSPRRSKVDIVQAAGRAMRIPRDRPDKANGFIFLPIYVEETSEETLEKALERTRMDELVDVLNAIREQDVIFANLIQSAQEARGRTGGFDDSILGERLAVLGPALSIDELRHSVAMRLIESMGVRWDFRYGELCNFRARFGHCNVSQKWAENRELGLWVSAQRVIRIRGQLSQDRVARLDALGFVWDFYAEEWEEKFSALQAFKAKHQHCNVSQGSREDSALASWLNLQRIEQRRGLLSGDYTARMEALGVIWDFTAWQWERKFAAMEAFKAAHNHCNVPSVRPSEYPELLNWANVQRRSRKRGELSDERIARLDALGFVWDPTAWQWERKFAAMEAFKAAHNHCNVPNVRSSENVELLNWAHVQRRSRKRGELSDERIARLDALGFRW